MKIDTIICCVFLLLLVFWGGPGIGAAIIAAIETLKTHFPGMLTVNIAFIFMAIVFFICNMIIRKLREDTEKNGNYASIKKDKQSEKTENILYLCKMAAMIIFILAGIQGIWLILPKLQQALQ